uniref:aminotransferase-like domain-containing protein n=1 Tax=Lentzea alba TaxID=2714351 RepID=UPI0039BEDA9F
MDRFQDPAELVEVLGDWASARGPLYRKLSGAMARAMRAGDLPHGERLPSERDLARMLQVSRATVVAAYDELRGNGMIASLRGSGTRVNLKPVKRRAGSDGRVPGGRATSIFQRLVDGPGEVISLAFAVEPAAPELADAVRELVDDDLTDLLGDVGYHPRGFPPFRDAIAAYYERMSVPTVPDQVLVTTGAQQALGLVAQMYLRLGSTVVVESPSWPGCLDVFRAAGAKMISVPLDDEGISADGLAQACGEHQPALLYVMPTYHNPTGRLMSAHRRQRVAEIAARFEVPVLEDNAYTSFNAGASSQVPPIAAYAPDGSEVITVGSLAKAVWGGLRMGWLRAPGGIIERLARYKVLADLASPVLDQAIAAKILPRLDVIAAGREQVVRARLHQLCELLSADLPEWNWQLPDGGSALWVELPDTDARVFAQIALRHGVEVVPGAAADPTGGHDNYLRLPFTFPEETLTELVRRLQRAWLELRRHGPESSSLSPSV